MIETKKSLKRLGLHLKRKKRKKREGSSEKKGGRCRERVAKDWRRGIARELPTVLKKKLLGKERAGLKSKEKGKI